MATQTQSLILSLVNVKGAFVHQQVKIHWFFDHIDEHDSSLGFATTCHIDCELLLPLTNSGDRCAKCAFHHSVFRSMHSYQCCGNAYDSSLPSSHTNYRYLSSPVKNECLQHLHKLSCAAGKQLKRLQEKLEAATETHRLDVDEGLHNGLKMVMMANSGRVASKLTLGSFPTIF